MWRALSRTANAEDHPDGPALTAACDTTSPCCTSPDGPSTFLTRCRRSLLLAPCGRRGSALRRWLRWLSRWCGYDPRHMTIDLLLKYEVHFRLSKCEACKVDLTSPPSPPPTRSEARPSWLASRPPLARSSPSPRFARTPYYLQSAAVPLRYSPTAPTPHPRPPAVPTFEQAERWTSRRVTTTSKQ